jgi:3-mercaptopropionate dioxygenase
MMRRLEDFVGHVRAQVSQYPQVPDAMQERALLGSLKPALEALLRHDDWLPESHAKFDPARYQQHPLYRDPEGRFSVVSFVWGPGHATPVHDHTVWGLVGVLRGAELCQHFELRDGHWEAQGEPHVVQAGEVDLVSPSIGDVHRVSNALPDQITISIHVYGADIGLVKRHVMTSGQAGVREFISGYSDVSPLLG